MLNTPFPPWPSFSEEEALAVADVVRSNRVNYWTGKIARAFEDEFAAWIGVPHAVALNNGTVALEAALRALGVGPGDEVIVTPRSFLASVSSAIFVGATPVFADVDRDTQNLSAETIAPMMSSRTKAILPVHLAGMPCDMDPILDLASASGAAVIEDCAQAHGARYKGRMVGSIGRIGAWSFCQDKIMTTGGEGGMVTTSDRDLWSFMWSYKDHGKNPDKAGGAHHAGYRWVHDSFGTNGRMLEVQAAIGRIQLRDMAQTTLMRQANAERIWDEARALPGLRVPEVPEWAEHAAYRAYIFLDAGAVKSGWNRDRVVAEINALGVPCYTGTCSEIYLEKAFEGTPWRPAQRLPNARELGETSVMFLVHPTLDASHLDLTCDALRAVMKQAVR